MQEGLDEETLALFDLLHKPQLSKAEIAQVKAVAVELLATLKQELQRLDNWCAKESTRNAIHVLINDFLYDERTGLPPTFSEQEVLVKADAVYHHIYFRYPTAQAFAEAAA